MSSESSSYHDKRDVRIGEHPINPKTGERYNPGNVSDPNHPMNPIRRRY